MKAIVRDSFLGDARQCRRMNFPAIGVGLSWADIVYQKNHNVRRILRQMAYWRQRTIGGLLHSPFGSATRFLWREWQLLLRGDGPDKRRAQDTKPNASRKCGGPMVNFTVVFVVHSHLVVQSHTFTAGAWLSAQRQIGKPPPQKRMRRHALCAARIFPRRWRRKALWQTKQCSPGIDRKRCWRCATPANWLQPSQWPRRPRAFLALRRGSERKGAGRRSDFQKASVPAMRR